MKRTNIEQKDQPIRVLQVLPALQAAGIENYVMNIYRNIDREKVQFDFLVHSKKKAFYDDEVERLGGKIYRLTYKDDKNYLKYIRDLNVFFKGHKEYSVIHGEMQSMMPVYLKIAKKNGVPVRIAHAHNSSYEKTLKGFVLHLLSRFAGWYSTINLACSDLAGKYLFGRKSFVFAPNAIDVNRFKFSETERKSIRKSIDVPDDAILVGHIGRFDYQKNHKKIVDIFYHFQKNNNAVLLLIGAGHLEKKIRRYVEKLGIDDRVRFAGLQRDIPAFLSSMDVFLMPSLYEGLPVSCVEAQCNGLPCVLSSVITDEVDITKNVRFVGLGEEVSSWGGALADVLKKNYDRANAYKKILGTEFDIRESCRRLEELYYKLTREGDTR